MFKKKKFWMVLIAVLIAVLSIFILNCMDNDDDTVPVFAVAQGPLTIGVTASVSVQSRDKVVLRI